MSLNINHQITVDLGRNYLYQMCLGTKGPHDKTRVLEQINSYNDSMHWFEQTKTLVDNGALACYNFTNHEFYSIDTPCDASEPQKIEVDTAKAKRDHLIYQIHTFVKELFPEASSNQEEALRSKAVQSYLLHKIFGNAAEINTIDYIDHGTNQDKAELSLKKLFDKIRQNAFLSQDEKTAKQNVPIKEPKTPESTSAFSSESLQCLEVINKFIPIIQGHKVYSENAKKLKDNLITELLLLKKTLQDNSVPAPLNCLYAPGLKNIMPDKAYESVIFIQAYLDKSPADIVVEIPQNGPIEETVKTQTAPEIFPEAGKPQSAAQELKKQPKPLTGIAALFLKLKQFFIQLGAWFNKIFAKLFSHG